MKKSELIFEGNEKQVFSTDNPDQVIFRYKDISVAYNNIKRARFIGKGVLDNGISDILLDYLNRNGVKTNFIEKTGPDEQLCRKIEIIPLEVIVRNRIAGSLAVRLGVQEGFRQSNTIVDLRYNNDELENPLINEHHAVALGLISYPELEHMFREARRANELLRALFHRAGILERPQVFEGAQGAVGNKEIVAVAGKVELAVVLDDVRRYRNTLDRMEFPIQLIG